MAQRSAALHRNGTVEQSSAPRGNGKATSRRAKQRQSRVVLAEQRHGEELPGEAMALHSTARHGRATALLGHTELSLAMALQGGARPCPAKGGGTVYPHHTLKMEETFQMQIPTLSDQDGREHGRDRAILCFKDGESFTNWCKWQNWLANNPLMSNPVPTPAGSPAPSNRARSRKRVP